MAELLTYYLRNSLRPPCLPRRRVHMIQVTEHLCIVNFGRFVPYSKGQGLLLFIFSYAQIYRTLHHVHNEHWKDCSTLKWTRFAINFYSFLVFNTDIKSVLPSNEFV